MRIEILAESTARAIIHAPLASIDLTEWLFALSDDEYQACSPAHIAGGTSLSKGGKCVSINVEQVGDSLLVQHYIGAVSKRDHCLVNSHSDSISPAGKTKIGVSWELKIKELTADSCEFSNHVVVTLTNEFSALLTAAGITYLAPIKMRMQENLDSHNKEETPLFAKDIEGKAVVGKWILQ